MEPSFNCGRNSVPNKVKHHNPTAATAVVTVTVIRLWAWQRSNSPVAIRFPQARNGLCFSLTFFFNNIDERTGTSVRVKIKAPNRAKPNV